MAKRFVDTALTRKAWFRKLEPKFKYAWLFLLLECDAAGVWSIDMDSLSFHVGEEITLDDLLRTFNSADEERIQVIDGDKLFLASFISFQYGELSEDCKPHQRVIKRLRDLNLIKGYPKGIQTLEEEEEEEEEDKEEEEGKGGTGENQIALPPAGGLIASQTLPHGSVQFSRPSFPLRAEDLARCKAEWVRTLAHFEIDRAVSIRDEGELGRGIQRYGPDDVCLALIGARKQKASAKFDPRQFVNLRSYFHPDRFDRLVNLGSGKESADGIDWGKVFAEGAA